MKRWFCIGITVISISTVICSGLVTSLTYYLGNYKLDWELVELNRDVLDHACYIASRMYEKTGVMVSDYSTLANSQLLPYRDWELPCGGGQVMIEVKHEGAKIEWVGKWHPPDGREHKTWPIYAKSSHQDPQQRTRKFLNALVQGPEWWVAQILHLWKYSETVNTSFYILVRRWYERGCVRRKYPKTGSIDAPPFLREGSEADLKAYRKWLCRVLGTSELTDAWGRSVKIEWGTHQLIARSAGADGLWDTHDDISVTKHYYSIQRRAK